MKKALLGLTALGMLAGCASNTNISAKSEPTIAVDMSVNNPPHTLTTSSSTEELDWISQSILDKGTDFLKSGISSLATYAFKAACAEMGIDVRDATTKKIDQIINQLTEMKEQIDQGFRDLTKKTQQVRDQTVMQGVLDKLEDVRSPILGELKTLEDIARKEQDPDYDKDSLEKQKIKFITEFKDKLNFYTLSNQVWHTTELLANSLARPNGIKPSQSLMDLYDNTLGANDIWDYQSYAPRMQFIQECSFLVNSLAILGKLECAYQISLCDEDDSNIEGIKQNVSDMCKAVNNVNGVFQKELQKLNDIKTRHDDTDKPTMSHLKRTFDDDGFVHISTDFTTSAYLATISVDDVIFKNTSTEFYNDNYSHEFKTFTANDDLYQVIYNDYTTYITSYEVEEGYNLKYYLRDLGFRIPTSRQKDFDEAIGIYKDIQVDQISRGVFRGRDFYASYRYYDWNGKLSANNFSRVGLSFWNNYDGDDVYQDNVNKKLLAFIDEDNQRLYGHMTWTIADRSGSSSSDVLSHIYKGVMQNDNDAVYYHVTE